MDYLNLNYNDKTLLKYYLRKYEINYGYINRKVKRCDGGNMTRKTADIKESHILRLIKKMEEESCVSKRGYERYINKRDRIKNIKEIYKKFTKSNTI